MSEIQWAVLTLPGSRVSQGASDGFRYRNVQMGLHMALDRSLDPVFVNTARKGASIHTTSSRRPRRDVISREIVDWGMKRHSQQWVGSST